MLGLFATEKPEIPSFRNLHSKYPESSIKIEDFLQKINAISQQAGRSGSNLESRRVYTSFV